MSKRQIFFGVFRLNLSYLIAGRFCFDNFKKRTAALVKCKHRCLRCDAPKSQTLLECILLWVKNKGNTRHNSKHLYCSTVKGGNVYAWKKEQKVLQKTDEARFVLTAEQVKEYRKS